MRLEKFSEDETNQIVEYGIKRGKVIFLTTFIALLLGGLMGVFYQGMIFWFCLSILRRYAGGYHADTQNRCYVISLIVVIISLLSIKQTNYIGTLSILLQFIGLLTILFLAPVENRNRILDKNEKKKYAIRTKTIAVLLCFIYIFLYIKNRQDGAIAIGMAYLVVAVSLITGYIKNCKTVESDNVEITR